MYPAVSVRQTPRTIDRQAAREVITPNVAFVTNVIPLYRYPVFELLRRSNRYRLQILVTMPLAQSCREAVATLPIKYSSGLRVLYSTHHPSSDAAQREPLSIPLALVRNLRKFRPDVIVSGGLGLSSMVCLCVARWLGTRIVLSSEEIASSAIGRSKLQQALRRFLVKRVDAFLVWGSAAESYLRGLNIQERRIFTCAQAIDNDFWRGQAHKLDRQSERTALGLNGMVFLLVGRAVQRKGFQNFLEAWSLLPQQLHSRISAVIVGDGAYLTTLKQIATKHKLTNVNFVGAKSGEELARFYAAADIFVLPSLEDVWGLVVNEAMCFGLPILASRYAGVSQSLIADSNIGAVFDPVDIEEFSMRLQASIDSPPILDPEACHKILKEVTFNRSIAAIQDMIASTTSPLVSNSE